MAGENQMLQGLQCPFSWEVTIDRTNSDALAEYNSNGNDQFYPLVMLMHDVMSVYISTNDHDDFEKVCTKLKKCEDDLVQLKERAHPEISTNVVQHILDATILHAFYAYKKIEEFEAQYQNVIPMHNGLDLTDKEKGTLEACKSIAWTKHDLLKSIDCIRRAVETNPKCDLWHFILGRELRRQRRDTDIHLTPTKEESDCFKRAYKMSLNSYFGVFYALSLDDNGKRREAGRLRNYIYQTRPREVDVLLRLAKGFMDSRVYINAQDCLDKVEVLDPDNVLYLHYRGMYYLKRQQCQEALSYLERAITNKKLGVEKDYLYCRAKVDKSFDATSYVLRMIEKYKDFPVKDIQHLKLELAECYAKRKDVIKALECFINAIRMEPSSSELQSFKCCVNSNKTVNVYQYLKEVFLPKVIEEIRNDGNVTELVHTLEELVDENHRFVD